MAQENKDASPLSEFVAKLRNLKAEVAEKGGIKRPNDCPQVIEKVKVMLKEFAEKKKDWWNDKYYECDMEKGFTTHIIHHEDDATLPIIVVSWLPNRSVPPHNHGTWSVVLGMEGKEMNTIWKRSKPDVNDSPLVKVQEQVFGQGDIVSFEPDTIHSVLNVNDKKSVSLHVYGWHLPDKTEFWIYPDGQTEDLRKYQPNEQLHRGKA